MKKLFVLSSLIAGALSFSVFAADPAPAPSSLSMVKTIPLGGTGNWDYIAVDPEGRRAFIPRGNHVQVVDLDKGTVITDIQAGQGDHGVALVLDKNLGFISSGRGNEAIAFDLKEYKVVKSIKTGANPDALCYDPASKHILTFDHSGGTVTVIDPADLDKAPVTIQVGGTLESGVPDGEGHVFVNVEDKSEIVQIDTKENKVLAHWSIKPAEGPTGLAYDAKNKVLFAGCNQKMAVVDATTGKVIATPTIGNGVDGAAYEPTLGLAFSSNGRDGSVSVVKKTGDGKYETVQTVKTVAGARTINVDLKNHQVLLPCNVPSAQGGGNTFGIAVVGEPAK